jgi:hypothetical protein
MAFSYITSKTHRFISVRIYPSEHMLKKFHEGDNKAHKIFRDISQKYYEFYMKFIEFATGKPYSEYQEEYFLGTKDSTMEELHELTGIKIAKAEGYDVYCIPRRPENDRLFDYIVENVPCKFKILQKTRGTYMDHGAQTWVRDSNRLSDEMRSKLRGVN